MYFPPDMTAEEIAEVREEMEMISTMWDDEFHNVNCELRALADDIRENCEVFYA